MKIFPKTRTTNTLVQELENELLVYDLKTNKAFCLNETSANVFQLCDGTKSVADISDLMSRKLKTLVSEDFVRLALNELKKDNLLENSDELKDFFAGMSRREMVKKVGLASMIAFPVISSVVAPSAANAASGGSVGCASPTCVRGGQICAGCFQPTFVIEYNSTDGSCSGGISSSYNTACFGPNPFGLSTTKDFRLS